ncbi:helix-turn-helix domain-containing protein [Salinibacillus xinjiangensis]|uniref:Helix-turn-helix domain-containing protein n=1 Tax=Salinibacillus xinjiangensis TaxID=1229268 RepID=A0A6G1X7A2_9BACI|nr:helix-turn-helix transcriptional regulator [Salinibacillus xinjiangensis]MRG86883.1 helix-turn-helix domain-containing protein [Salinibacillus xinjiangensis]
MKSRETLSKVIGDRIRLLRKKAGLSQEELGHRAGLHPTYIGQLERGEKNATLESIDKVANALRVSLDAIVGFTDTKITAQNETLIEIIQYLNKANFEEQKVILKIVKLLIEWREKSSS